MKAENPKPIKSTKSTLIIDPSIFLEYFLDQEKSQESQILLDKISNEKIKAFITSTSIDSIMIVLERNKTQPEKIKVFLTDVIKSKGLSIYHARIKDRLKCFNFMKKYNLDYEDSLIIQSAITNNCDKIISFDKNFNKVEEIQKTEPSQI